MILAAICSPFDPLGSETVPRYLVDTVLHPIPFWGQWLRRSEPNSCPERRTAEADIRSMSGDRTNSSPKSLDLHSAEMRLSSVFSTHWVPYLLRQGSNS